MKLSTAHKIGRFFQYFVLILVGVIMIYPLVWMVGATFKSNAEIFCRHRLPDCQPHAAGLH